MRALSLLTGLGLGSLLFGCGGGSSSPTAPTTGGANTVTVGDNYFSPVSLSVPVNTTVTWSWVSGSSQHNVTFDDNSPPSGPLSSGTFTRTFGGAGTFTYYCSIHGRAIMHGSVTVAAAGTSSGGGTGGSGMGGGGTGGGTGGGGYGMP
jgi:plastocyanin